MGLGGQLALAGEVRPRQEAAVELCGDGRRVEGKHQFRRALLAEVGERGQSEVEIDRLLFPVELARAGEGSGERRQAEIRRDMLDVLFRALLVVNEY